MTAEIMIMKLKLVPPDTQVMIMTAEGKVRTPDTVYLARVDREADGEQVYKGPLPLGTYSEEEQNTVVIADSSHG